MKQTKKLLALVLALVMTFSLMAVTAAAAGTEEHEHVCSTETIQPRIPAVTCSYCGQGMAVLRTDRDDIGRFTEYKCMNEDCRRPGNTKIIHW